MEEWAFLFHAHDAIAALLGFVLERMVFEFLPAMSILAF
jgi:hypothetical protein